MKKKIVWSYDTSNWDRNEAAINYREMYDCDPTDYELDRFIDAENYTCFRCEEHEVNYYECKHGHKHYIVLADIGRWNGRFDGGKVIKGLWQSIYECLEDYNEIYQEGKRLKVTAIHHDGTNYFQIRELTDRGYEYWQKHQYDMSDRELHQRLFKDSHYSHEVSLFNEIYGW